MNRAATSSQPEDLFVDLFSQVFGVEKAQLLVPELDYKDFDGVQRFVDFALKTAEGCIAFEIDGPHHYIPETNPVIQYEDDLLRQNSLINDGWRVFRWTDRQLAEHPERVKEQLALFLASIPGLLEFDDFLPKQLGAVLELRPHQKDARDWFNQIRSEGKTIALLNLATGTGKTVIAIDDARSVNGRTLYLAHRKTLITQTRAPSSGSSGRSQIQASGLAECVTTPKSTRSSVLQFRALWTDSRNLHRLPLITLSLTKPTTHRPTTYVEVLHHFRPGFIL
ncbi:MAG TPA: DEAD/DEAH box helicase family protein [Blastocatellia bacterium]|nr:DEAD/DEAH box helicase family protein [Blastocatellia bacterium]